MQTVYRVMMPLLTPAIFASTVLVFSSVVDDFVLVDLLNSNSSNTPMSLYIYSQQRGGNGGTCTQRPRHDHACHVLRRCARRLLRLQVANPRRAGRERRGPGGDRRRRLSNISCSGAYDAWDVLEVEGQANSTEKLVSGRGGRPG